VFVKYEDAGRGSEDSSLWHVVQCDGWSLAHDVNVTGKLLLRPMRG
jgi:hypothetical protein